MNNASVFSFHCLSIGALKICFFQYPTLTQQLLFKAVAQCVWGLCVYGSFSGFHVERNPFVPNNSRVKKLWQYTVGLLCLSCCCFTGSVALYKQYSITDLKQYKDKVNRSRWGRLFFFNHLWIWDIACFVWDRQGCLLSLPLNSHSLDLMIPSAADSWRMYPCPSQSHFNSFIWP